jgi:hypothetical protein
MTLEQFTHLLESYGADPRRWPQGQREAAHQLIAQNLPQVEAALAAAAQLDGWLAGDSVAAADPALVDRILARTVPPLPTSTPAPRHSWWRASWLWPGAGFAGVGLAGSLAGALIVSFALPAAGAAAADGSERSTAFVSASSDWSDE